MAVWNGEMTDAKWSRQKQFPSLKLIQKSEIKRENIKKNSP